jgi:hypothetical protein
MAGHGIGDGVIATDMKGRVTFANSVALTLTGRKSCIWSANRRGFQNTNLVTPRSIPTPGAIIWASDLGKHGMEAATRIERATCGLRISENAT